MRRLSGQDRFIPAYASSDVKVYSYHSAAAMTIDEMKEEIVRLTNSEHVEVGVPELEVSPALVDCAQAKADDFLNNNYFSHTSPVYGTAGNMISALLTSAIHIFCIITNAQEPLLRHPQKVYSRLNIYESVWNEDFLGDENIFIFHAHPPTFITLQGESQCPKSS